MGGGGGGRREGERKKRDRVIKGVEDKTLILVSFPSHLTFFACDLV